MEKWYTSIDREVFEREEEMGFPILMGWFLSVFGMAMGFNSLDKIPSTEGLIVVFMGLGTMVMGVMFGHSEVRELTKAQVWKKDIEVGRYALAFSGVVLDQVYLGVTKQERRDVEPKLELYRIPHAAFHNYQANMTTLVVQGTPGFKRFSVE